VKDTIGQHLGRTTYTTATPATCTFYRSDGDWGATVTPSNLATAKEAARQAVTIPGANAEPVDLPSGGAVNIIKDGAILATSRGTLLLVVKINQQSPLEATLIAEEALKHL
jgi:hypothetical protein